MRILFVGDTSNFYVSLASALQTLGHECVIISDGCHWLNTFRNHDLSRQPGVWGGVKYVAKLLTLLPKMRGFDVVHLRCPIFLSLKPEKVRLVLNYLKRNNRLVVLTALGTDCFYYDTCHDGKTFRYSDYFVGDKPSPYRLSQTFQEHELGWEFPNVRRYHDYLLDNVDGVIACLYEYFVTYQKYAPAEKLFYSGTPICTTELVPEFITETPEKVKFFIGMYKGRTVIKGTDLMLEALKRVHDRYPNESEITVVESVPYEQYKSLMRSSHVALDQLYSYTPSTNALIAMAQGTVAVSGAEEEFYQFIGEKECRPVINVSPLVPGDIDRQLEHLITHRHLLPQLSRQSREFVVKHNEATLVARRHLDAWKAISNLKNNR